MRVLRRSAVALGLVAALGVGILPGAALAQSPAASAVASPGPGERPMSGDVLDDPDATGMDLFTAYSNLLVAKDAAGLDKLLGAGFLIQRTDGSRHTKDEYLADLPDLTAFSFTDPLETRDGDLIALALVTTAELVIDGTPYQPDPAPMLAVFQWNGVSWNLVSQSNFHLPQP